MSWGTVAKLAGQAAAMAGAAFGTVVLIDEGVDYAKRKLRSSSSGSSKKSKKKTTAKKTAKKNTAKKAKRDAAKLKKAA